MQHQEGCRRKDHEVRRTLHKEQEGRRTSRKELKQDDT